MRWGHRFRRKEVEASAAGTLAGVPEGADAVVRGVAAGSGLVQRLQALGLTPGTPVRVLSNSGARPLIVEVRGSRLALGLGMARRIQVEHDDRHGPTDR